MAKRRAIIQSVGPSKQVQAPVIITTAGKEVVHEDAAVQTPNSVTEHVITGDVDPDATDDGALQSPILPVEVTSGKLAPAAVYDAKNWGGDIQWAYSSYNVGYVINSTFNQGEASGDLVVVTCWYNCTDYSGAPTISSETNVNRLFYSEWDNANGNNYAHFFGIWKLTAAFGSNNDLEFKLGPSACHMYGVAVVRDFSEYY